MLSLIGSTGSIGKQTLQGLEHLGQRPLVLAANRNVIELEEQCRRHTPKLAVLADEGAARDLRVRLADTGTQVLGGEEAVCEAAAHPEADVTLVASVGVAGLKPVMAAIGSVPRLALANKESLVYAGRFVMESIKKHRTELLPVDSELSAIFQCQEAKPKTAIRHITLTASGGPFFGRKLESLRNVTVEEALRHPNWQMGGKITVDSATLLNKGYEVFEAMYYFDKSIDEISVVIHRESIVHSIVGFVDGATLMHLATPDMRLPIQYALTYPELQPSLIKPLDLTEKPLSFAKPDVKAFPCLALAYEAANRGGYAGAVLAAAGELAVERFIAGKISFTDIAEYVAAALGRVPDGEPSSVEDVIAVDAEIRDFICKTGAITHRVYS